MMHKIALLLLLTIFVARAQKPDSTYHISGAASATNNGISLLPMFTRRNNRKNKIFGYSESV